MGNLCGKSNAPTKGASLQQKASKPKLQPVDLKGEGRVQDAMVQKQKGIKVFRGPNSIRGNQFIVEDCEDCDIYVLDVTATVSVDECKNCRIFIGPCESSIFVRDCTDCKFQLACQQYRSRDCQNCDTLLYCKTAPVVETSKNMRFGCWEAQYFDLQEQLEMAGLSPFQNLWSEVYDFNSNPAADFNWSFLPLAELGTGEFMARPSKMSSTISPEEESVSCVIPRTYGGREPVSTSLCFGLAMVKGQPSGVDRIPELVDLMLPNMLGPNPDLVIVRTRQMMLDEGNAKALFSKCKDSKAELIKNALSGQVVGLEFCGDSCISRMHEILAKLGGTAAIYLSADESAAKHETNLFFVQWKEHTGHSLGVTK